MIRMWKHSKKRTLGALGALGTAAVIAVGSGASYTADSANPGNMITAGALTMSNDKDGTAVFDNVKLNPGESKTGTVKIGNTGDASGAFTLAFSNISGDAQFRENLQVKITDPNGDPLTDQDAVPADGSASDVLSRTYVLGQWEPGTERTYTFKVTYPNGGFTPDGEGGDNGFMGDTVEFDANWNAISIG